MLRLLKFSIVAMVLCQNRLIESTEDIKIQSGREVDIKHFPFVGKVHVIRACGELFCTAFLISWNIAITVAHCVKYLRSAVEINEGVPFITMGVSDCLDEKDPLYQIRRIVKIIMHDKFSEGVSPSFRTLYDIGAMKFGKPMKPSPTVQLAPLIPLRLQPLIVVDEIMKSGKHCEVPGWGFTSLSFPHETRALRFAYFDIISKLKCCKEHFPRKYDYCMKSLGLPSGYQCFVRVVHNTSITQGDSGAPIVCPHRGHRYVVGVVVSGKNTYDPPQNGSIKVSNPSLRVMETVMAEFIQKVMETAGEMTNSADRMIARRIISLVFGLLGFQYKLLFPWIMSLSVKFVFYRFYE